MDRLGHPEKLGFPVLVVLSPDLRVLHTQESGSLETADKAHPGHDARKVLGFLEAWDGHGRSPSVETGAP
ncbi:MAG: hypothetical protein ACM3O7_02630 [Acidobacteriota bacterium]